ncbi:MAG: hypothetical protein ACI9KE_006632 [Polyangiales bacterium]|jgi:hypothetical protein
MRLLLAVVLLQACVSSSIQLGEDLTRDGGPVVDAAVDAPVADAKIDVPPTPDAGACSSAAPPSWTCYSATCEVIDPFTDPTTCEVVCEPAPSECFEGCDDDDECSVGYECCDGPECDLVARNEIAHADYLERCPGGEPPLFLIARCIEETCEVTEFSDCELDGTDECVVLLNADTECGGNVAINVDAVEDYIATWCDPDDAPLPSCCRTLGEIDMTGPAECNAVYQCEATDD